MKLQRVVRIAAALAVLIASGFAALANGPMGTSAPASPRPSANPGWGSGSGRGWNSPSGSGAGWGYAPGWNSGPSDGCGPSPCPDGQGSGSPWSSPPSSTTTDAPVPTPWSSAPPPPPPGYPAAVAPPPPASAPATQPTTFDGGLDSAGNPIVLQVMPDGGIRRVQADGTPYPNPTFFRVCIECIKRVFQNPGTAEDLGGAPPTVGGPILLRVPEPEGSPPKRP